MRHSGTPLFNHHLHQQQQQQVTGGSTGGGNYRVDQSNHSNREKWNNHSNKHSSTPLELQITNGLRSLNRRDSVEDLTVVLERNHHQTHGLKPIQPTPPPINRQDSLANDVFTYQDESMKTVVGDDVNRLPDYYSNESYRNSIYFESPTSLIATTPEEEQNADYSEDDDPDGMLMMEGADRDSVIMLHSDDEDNLEDEWGGNYPLSNKKVKVFPFLAADSPPDSKKKGAPHTSSTQQASLNHKRKEKMKQVKQELELGRTSPSLFSINSQTPPPFRKSPCPSLDSFHQNSFYKKKLEVMTSSLQDSLLVQIPNLSLHSPTFQQDQHHHHHNLSTVPIKPRPSSMKVGTQRKKHQSDNETKTSRSVSSHSNVNLNCLQKDPIPDDYLGHHIATTSSRIQSKYKEHFAVSKNPILVIANRNQYKETKADREQANRPQSPPKPRKLPKTIKDPSVNRTPLYKTPQPPKRKKLTPDDLGLTYQASIELDRSLPTSCQVDAKKVIMQTLINSWIGIGPSLGDVNIENRKPLNLKPSKITSSNPEERRREILKLMYKDRQAVVKESILKPKQSKKNR